MSVDAIRLETGPKPEAAVIWLHGLGADGHDFEPIVPELRLAEGSVMSAVGRAVASTAKMSAAAYRAAGRWRRQWLGLTATMPGMRTTGRRK